MTNFCISLTGGLFASFMYLENGRNKLVRIGKLSISGPKPIIGCITITSKEYTTELQIRYR